MANRSNPLLGAVLTSRSLRVLSAAVLASALAMPWLAWWGGAFGEAREVVLPERIIEYRPALVALPGGTFMMGSSPAERDRVIAEAVKAGSEIKDAEGFFRDEVRHAAEVGDFELCRTEVTQGQWKAVMGVTELQSAECGDEVCEDGKPITGVTWFEAVGYLNRLTERENERLAAAGKLTLCYQVSVEKVRWERSCTGYRLPTEVEWEYAARAGSETAYFFGDDPTKLCEHGNVADRTATAKHPDWTVVDCDDRAADLASVGGYRANAWGLYDVHGNVWEWVWDWYADYEEHPPKNYVGPETGSARVLRSGSFGVGPGNLRSADRLGGTPAVSSEYVGLRCARGSHPRP